jgi:hypothetical protein
MFPDLLLRQMLPTLLRIGLSMKIHVAVDKKWRRTIEKLIFH